MTSPPDLHRAHRLLMDEAATAFAFLRDEGFEPSYENEDALEVEFRSTDRRLVVMLRPRRDPRYRLAEVRLGRRGRRELLDLDHLATYMPDDIDPAPGRGGGPNIDDEEDVVPAVRHLADRVRREWLGFLRADAGVFDRIEAERERVYRASLAAAEDRGHVERGRLAFEERDYARAAAELGAAPASALTPADAKRLDIARRRS